MTDRPDPQESWARLDPRMLLVQPVQAFVKFFPSLVGLLIASGAVGNIAWGLLGIVLPLLYGVASYLTTTYRITDALVELRFGVLSRHTLTTQLDRVRSVDLTSTLVHRWLGLASVVIGTGSTATSSEDQLKLDGLPRAKAQQLRITLLDRTGRADFAGVRRDGEVGESAPDAASADSSTEDLDGTEQVVSFDARWLRFAPFTPEMLVTGGIVAGASSQLSDWVGGWDVVAAIDLPDIPTPPIGLLIAGLVVAVLIAAIALTIADYLIAYANFALTRDSGGWHIRRGLLTTRETSLDPERLAGVRRGESVMLRAAGGAQLKAIVTGLRTTGVDTRSSTLVPPAPAGIVQDAATTVLGTAEPMSCALRPHGPAAVRRRYAHALTVTLLFVVAPLLLMTLAFDAPLWLLAIAPASLVGALLLARDRAHTLGHEIVDRHLVARSGSLTCGREALATGHIIGWTMRDTWFQRRSGLMTLTATTAGGAGRVDIPDIPAGVGVDLADAALPDLIDQFR